MGTSNLYKGPKSKFLLPSDYTPDTMIEQGVPIDAIDSNNDKEKEEKGPASNNNEDRPTRPANSWNTARSSIRKAMNDRRSGNIKRAIRNYTKALGGHANATRQAAKMRNTAQVIYSYFAGTPEAIRNRFEDLGIQFVGRTTNEIFGDICNLIAPVPFDLEDSLVNMALQETFADIVADQSIDLETLESFNETLLQKLVGGLMKHYIFDKLIFQSEQTALRNCENSSHLHNLEKIIKQYIDGIVDSVVPRLVRNGMSQDDFNRALETLCDISYQQMEELR